jgi:hypothetical protein
MMIVAKHHWLLPQMAEESAAPRLEIEADNFVSDQRRLENDVNALIDSPRRPCGR